MSEEEILLRANAIANPHGLKAEIFPGIYSVGVGGDQRTYTPVINLTFEGSFPGWELIEKVKTEIQNTLPINRVTIEIPPQ